MTVLLIIAIFPSFIASTARIQFEYIGNTASNGSKQRCFEDIVSVLNDIDHTKSTKINPWSNDTKRDWLPNIILLLENASGHNIQL